MQEISLKTDRKTQLVNITEQVQAALGEPNGAAAALVYVPHTTAGVTINEHADPLVAAGPRERDAEGSSTTAGTGSTSRIPTARTRRRTCARR